MNGRTSGERAHALNSQVVNRWRRSSARGLKNVVGHRTRGDGGFGDHYTPPACPEGGRGTAPAGCRILIMCLQCLELPLPGVAILSIALGRIAPILSLSNNNASSPATWACWPRMALCARRACATTASSARSTIRRSTNRCSTGFAPPRPSPPSTTRSMASMAATHGYGDRLLPSGAHPQGVVLHYPAIDQLWLLKVMETVDEAEVEKGTRLVQGLLAGAAALRRQDADARDPQDPASPLPGHEGGPMRKRALISAASRASAS